MASVSGANRCACRDSLGVVMSDLVGSFSEHCEELSYVWAYLIILGICRSTGVGPTDFTTSLPFAKTARGRIAVDDCLHVLVHPHKEDHGPQSPAEV